jgi:hypothetical protein
MGKHYESKIITNIIKECIKEVLNEVAYAKIKQNEIHKLNIALENSNVDVTDADIKNNNLQPYLKGKTSFKSGDLFGGIIKPRKVEYAIKALTKILGDNGYDLDLVTNLITEKGGNIKIDFYKKTEESEKGNDEGLKIENAVVNLTWYDVNDGKGDTKFEIIAYIG